MGTDPANRLPPEIAAEALQRAVQSGTPLATGLRAYAEECPAEARAGLLSLAQSVENGVPLAAAVEQPQYALPPYLKALIQAGIQSQQVGTMLEEYLRQRRRQRRVSQRLSLDLIYPLFMVYFTVGVSCFILGFVVPIFSEIFDGFGVQLPNLTEFMVQLSRVVLFLRVPIVLVMGGMAVGMLLLLAGNRWLAPWAGRIPLLGQAARLASYSEFCSLLAPLVEAGQPLPQALAGTAAGMTSGTLRQEAEQLASQYDGATTLEETANRVRFPLELSNLFRWESRGTAFGEILRSWADLFAQASEGRSGVLMAILSPIVIILAGCFVGTLVISLMLPMIRLLNELS